MQPSLLLTIYLYLLLFIVEDIFLYIVIVLNSSNLFLTAERRLLRTSVFGRMLDEGTVAPPETDYWNVALSFSNLSLLLKKALMTSIISPFVS